MFLIPVAFSFQILSIYYTIQVKESGRIEALERLARQVTCKIWGIDEDQLEGRLTKDVTFGDVSRTSSAEGQMM